MLMAIACKVPLKRLAIDGGAGHDVFRCSTIPIMTLYLSTGVGLNGDPMSAAVGLRLLVPYGCYDLTDFEGA